MRNKFIHWGFCGFDSNPCIRTYKLARMIGNLTSSVHMWMSSSELNSWQNRTCMSHMHTVIKFDANLQSEEKQLWVKHISGQKSHLPLLTRVFYSEQAIRKQMVNSLFLILHLCIVIVESNLAHNLLYTCTLGILFDGYGTEGIRNDQHVTKTMISCTTQSRCLCSHHIWIKRD